MKMVREKEVIKEYFSNSLRNLSFRLSKEKKSDKRRYSRIGESNRRI